MGNFDWIQLHVTAPRERLDELCAIMCMIDTGLQIEDYGDIEPDALYGELIDENILNADKTFASVSVYIAAEKFNADVIAFLRERMAACEIDGGITVNNLREEDWAHAWKQYYKPVKAGEKIVIVPLWEDYERAPGEIMVKMDPGMAFGTGTHETTRLMIELLEQYITPGCSMLDIGCGSGILAVCAAKLGAVRVAAYDLDPVAVRVARENVAVNEAGGVVCGLSDLLDGVHLSGGRFDVVAANIVADVILRLLPGVGRYMSDTGALLLSGIIDARADEVIAAAAERGFALTDRREENGWCSLAVRVV